MQSALGTLTRCLRRLRRMKLLRVGWRMLRRPRVSSVARMEAYESIVAVALENEGFVVAGPVKFPIQVHVKKEHRTEIQTHGYEVDLIAARADRLVLATVKSYFGSRGVVADHVIEAASDKRNGYRLLNDPPFRAQMVKLAADRYRYAVEQVRVRLYAGRFAPASGQHEERIRNWCSQTCVGGGPIEVFGPHQVAEQLLVASANTQYRDNPVLATLKLLRATGHVSDASTASGLPS